jgi:hypothetical protein
VAGAVIDRGTVVSLDGTAGLVATGALERGPGADEPLLRRLLRWCTNLVEIPIAPHPVPAPPQPSDSTLVLDDPNALSVDAANKALADANRAGITPEILISSRWARAATKSLHGTCRRLGCLDEVISLPLIARTLNRTTGNP